MTKVTVTQDDINNGCRGAEFRCPVHRALRRVFSTTAEVFGVSDMVVFGDGISIQLPDKAIDFIDRFDDGGRLKPFSFWLPLS